MNKIRERLIVPNIEAIIDYCKKNPKELEALLTLEYSNEKIKLNQPFFADVDKEKDIKELNKYYDNEPYIIFGKIFRVARNFDFERHAYPFIKYIESIGIKPINYNVDILPKKEPHKNNFGEPQIADAQNPLVRYVMGKLSTDAFAKDDWETARSFFSSKCVYCGKKRSTSIDHAIPINRDEVGEHKLGNLLPCCGKCNRSKSSRKHNEFLNILCHEKGEITKEYKMEIMDKIEKYMLLYNYKPFEQEMREKISQKLKELYVETNKLADKYVEEIRDLINSRQDK